MTLAVALERKCDIASYRSNGGFYRRSKRESVKTWIIYIGKNVHGRREFFLSLVLHVMLRRQRMQFTGIYSLIIIIRERLINSKVMH